jgi:hypothetical protein
MEVDKNIISLETAKQKYQYSIDTLELQKPDEKGIKIDSQNRVIEYLSKWRVKTKEFNRSNHTPIEAKEFDADRSIDSHLMIARMLNGRAESANKRFKKLSLKQYEYQYNRDKLLAGYHGDFYLWIGQVGILMLMVGGCLWYVRIQRYQDRILKKQADDNAPHTR